MHFIETKLKGAYCITLDPNQDERGYFARTFCKKEFDNLGLHNDFVQCNLSYNRKKGTLRGLHYQLSPHEEVKIVSCRKGAIFDVIVDMRHGSETYGQWFSVELSEQNKKSLYIPAGFAHGFQTLVDETEVYYQMGQYYVPDSARGIIWSDQSLKITWPIDNPIISERDKSFPGLMK